MKKTKKLLSILCSFAMIFALSACSSGSSSSNSDDSNSDESANEGISVKIEDIDWEFGEFVTDGKRYSGISFTNNSEYVITYFKLNLIESDEVTEDVEEDYLSYIQSENDYSDDELEELRSKDSTIAVNGDSSKLVKVGEAVNNIRCRWTNASGYVQTSDYNDYLVPDIAEISYVEGDKIYTEYYDFINDSYTLDDSTKDAIQWNENNELLSLISKPDSSVIEVGFEDEDECMLDAYGMSLDDYNNYVQDCKDKGFTNDVDSYETYYDAYNEDGYEVYITYDSNKESMSIDVIAPDEN